MFLGFDFSDSTDLAENFEWLLNYRYAYIISLAAVQLNPEIKKKLSHTSGTVFIQ